MILKHACGVAKGEENYWPFRILADSSKKGGTDDAEVLQLQGLELVGGAKLQDTKESSILEMPVSLQNHDEASASNALC